ncbi:hypothetical protein [Cupriavidus basilensis]|uniref:Uncharacterized protein n=1 Tax=Cupriavidus basilensis TaxID=68895 RepID=A0A643FSN4_9BURK|nr:hypothetical protein [Cupriavidus basilensis]QOT82264.1 hypothetical protein F7R26_039180 [Cupriavidus basilensis]
MKNTNNVALINPESEHFVPTLTDVVSPATLAQVFGDHPVPFKTNEDGSAPTSVYLQHLEDTWALAMEEAETDEVQAEHAPARDLREVSVEARAIL